MKVGFFTGAAGLTAGVSPLIEATSEGAFEGGGFASSVWMELAAVLEVAGVGDVGGEVIVVAAMVVEVDVA